jgi:hypothetical protein
MVAHLYILIQISYWNPALTSFRNRNKSSQSTASVWLAWKVCGIPQIWEWYCHCLVAGGQNLHSVGMRVYLSTDYEICVRMSHSGKGNFQFTFFTLLHNILKVHFKQWYSNPCPTGEYIPQKWINKSTLDTCHGDNSLAVTLNKTNQVDYTIHMQKLNNL